MPSKRVARELNNGTYFLTLVVYKHLGILPYYGCWNILAQSLNYYINGKKGILEGFVFMRDHLHLIVNSEDIIYFVRGFKRFTAKVIKRKIPLSIQHQLRNNKGLYQFWDRRNMPLWIETEDFFHQKLNYIHENPISAGYVDHEEDWYWSSANESCKILVDRSNW